MTLILATLCRLLAFATISFSSSSSSRAQISSLLLSAVFSGAANAMVSGTKDALLYESLQHLNLQSKFNTYVSTASLMWPMGSALSGVLGSAIVSYTGEIRDTFLISLVPLVFALCSSYFISETSHEFKICKKKNKQQQQQQEQPSILSTSIQIMKSRKLKLLALFVVGNFAFYETTLQFRGVFLRHNGVNETGIGIWDSVRFVLSSLGTLLAPRFITHGLCSRRVAVLICVCTACISIIMASSSLSTHTTTPYLLLAAFAWGVQWPLEKALINDMVPSNSRATAISIISLLKKAGASITLASTSHVMDRTNNINTAFFLLGSVAVANTLPLLMMIE
jgi:MFS-type transporter involved in bile tolerance (Atg22 family)